MAAVMVLCGTCRASLFRPRYDHLVVVIADKTDSDWRILTSAVLTRVFA
jgi:hypothetical protein